MFQCLGLGSADEGGCGEDWWHPECLLGLKRGWWRKDAQQPETKTVGNSEAKKEEEGANGETNGDGIAAQDDEEDPPLPPGFPSEDDFDGLLCYKCVNAFPWIKRYAGTEGFLPGIHHNPPTGAQPIDAPAAVSGAVDSKKRKADDADEEGDDLSSAKRHRSSSQGLEANPAPSLVTVALPVAITPPETAATTPATTTTAPAPPTCRYETLPPTLPTSENKDISLLLQPTFRDHLCRCPTHFPLLKPHPYLLDEEETYEPPVSESSIAGDHHSAGSKSLLDRGEAALSNIDRVRAIEGVMVYNHLRDKVKDFLQPFAESGKIVGAEDIKKYFESLRGDAEAMKQMRAQQMAAAGGGDGEDDNRREQGGY